MAKLTEPKQIGNHLSLNCHIDCKMNERGRFDSTINVKFEKDGKSVEIPEMAPEESDILAHLLRNAYLELDKEKIQYFKSAGYIDRDKAEYFLSEINLQIEKLKTLYNGSYNVK